MGAPTPCAQERSAQKREAAQPRNARQGVSMRMGSGDPAADPLSSFLRHPGASFSLSRRIAMARDATATADLLPLLVVLLIAAHVLALGYWIYRLATDGSRQSARSKKH